MQILTHICCGPCALYPLQWLKENNYDVYGYFYNPNIHPFREFKKRIEALKELCNIEKFPLEIDENYGLTDFLRQVVNKEQNRCSICITNRLEATARMAKERNIPYFTTTLLYSKYQNHLQIKKTCQLLADKYNLDFVYHDFREGWQHGIDQSLKLNLYRQPYCGCIYSEQERYDKKFKKKTNC